MSQISSNILQTRRLQSHSRPFFPLALHFTTLLLGHVQKSNFGIWVRKWPMSLPFCTLLIFFTLPFFSFWDLFTIVIDLLLGLLPVKKILREHLFTMEWLSVLAGNFAASFSLTFFHSNF